MSTPVLIGVDWGTSAFRAFLIDADGAVLDRRSGPHGILAVTDGNFGAVLEIACRRLARRRSGCQS